MDESVDVQLKDEVQCRENHRAEMQFQSKKTALLGLIFKVFSADERRPGGGGERDGAITALSGPISVHTRGTSG